MKVQPRLCLIVISLLAFSKSVCASLPVVDNVRMVQDASSRTVTITYQLRDAPGIVTVDIQTNGVSIGAKNFRNIAGDVNKEIQPAGVHMITWEAEKSWEGHKVSNATAKVCAWVISAPPPYMAIDLRLPSQNDNLRWYTSEDALPEGIESDIYRSSILVMRKIYQPEGGEWIMGSPECENYRGTGRDGFGLENYHRVTLTNDYWMSVFQITQKQWTLVMNVNESPSYFKKEGEAWWMSRPVEQVSYQDIRGTDVNSQYPIDSYDNNSFMGRISSLTGLSFDLPTEMQWEYACRAGTDTSLNNGKNLTENKRDPELDKLGRYGYNGGKVPVDWGLDNAKPDDPNHGTTRVGSYLPNNWGLYDMHGNVWEYCLDWYSEDIQGLNGIPPASGGKRILRGGTCQADPSRCRSASRGNIKPDVQDRYAGFRVVCSPAI